jgi:exodeoxyribonuclease V alpha subunit
MTAMAPVNSLLQAGALRAVDHALAQSLLRLRPDTPSAVLLAAALCSRALAQGHSQLPLSRVQALLAEIAPERELPELPMRDDWLATLHASPWVSAPLLVGAALAANAFRDDPASIAATAPAGAGANSLAGPKGEPQDAASQAAPTSGGSVLVLENDAVSLRRYWSYEVRLATALRARAANAGSALDAATYQRIAAAFPSEGEALQARAAEIALASRLLLLTGGPGTGKTRTVATILGVFAEQARAAGNTLRMARAAPTGKAAARLAEALRDSDAALSLPAQTLHRLLGLSGDGRPPRFDARHPLPFDVVVVDEASMVDLPMMTRLVEAVSAETSLILVGDPDQLPSVDAGAVLGALCDASRRSELATDALAAHHVHLDRSYRQTDALDLAPLTAAIRSGDADAAVDLLTRSVGVHWHRGSDAALAAFVRERAIAQFRQLQRSPDLPSALHQAKRFRVLTALRDGPAGSQTLNALIARELQGGTDTSAFFPGRLILISENSYRHGLFNGDIGLCWPDAAGVLRVWFESDGNGDDPAHIHGPRAWHPAQLPAHESAFALTVHKAQGSEFGRILLALPEHDARVITRELLYTGLSRGREGVIIWAGETLLRLAIARKIARWNGLAARLS